MLSRTLKWSKLPDWLVVTLALRCRSLSYQDSHREAEVSEHAALCAVSTNPSGSAIYASSPEGQAQDSRL